MTTVEVIQRSHDLSDATQAQKAVIAFLEFAYRDVPFMSVDQVASGSGVSKATVVRLVQRLGYDSFDALKRQIRESLYAAPESPATRIKEVAPTPDIESLIAGHKARQFENLERTFAALDSGAVSELCATLIAAERVFVYGQRFSYGLAFNLGLRLSQVLPAVFTVSGAAGTAADSFSGARPSDHVIIVAHKRLGNEKATLIEFLKHKRVEYSLITDLGDEPITRAARHVIRGVTTRAGAFNLYASSHVIIEVLSTVLEAYAPSAVQRVTDTEVAFQHFRTFES